MKTDTILFTSLKQAKDYLHLVKNKYQNVNGFNYFINDLIAALNYTLNNQHQTCYFIKIYDEYNLIAHIGLTIDERIKKNGAIFGCFECIENNSVFIKLWNTLLELAKEKNINNLMGPVNGTTWHQYRLIKPKKNDFPIFVSEPLSEKFYYEYLNNCNPSKEINYYSGLRSSFNSILEITKPAFLELNNKGLTIENISEINIKTSLDILNICRKVFRNNWGYVNLTDDEFLSLYSKGKLDKFVRSVYFAKLNSKLIGFCSVINDSENFIIKSIGILPEFQEKGIGNAIIYKVHKDALDSGIKNVIYALIQEDNKVKHFPKDDAKRIREYACFSFTI